MSAGRQPLEARIETAPDGRMRVLSPAVGWWTGMPASGAVLGPGASVGRLLQLHHPAELRLPEGAAGRVTGGPDDRRRVAVEYGQLLFELEAPVGGQASDAVAGSEKVPREQGLILRAPTDGVFYRSPSPDAAPYVSPGDRIRRGQPVGLIEVMKTFNQIAFDGPGLPEEAEVKELLAADGAEVRAGDPLLRIG